MKLSSLRLLIILSILTGISLACSLPARVSTPPPTPVPLSTAQVKQFETQVQATLANPNPSGEVAVTITQAQLTAFVAAQLAKEPNQTITDPQVVLTNGHVEIYSKVHQSGFTADSKIVMQPRVDEQGNPRLDILSINLGPFPVPDTFRSRVETLVDTTLQDYLASNSDQFKVKSIKINEGSMTITGVRQ